MHTLPTGTVTFLFTDIEGSTRLLGELGDRYASLLAEHRRLLRATIVEKGGQEVDTQGEGHFIAFARARDAVATAVAAQHAFRDHPWPEGVAVRVRMGLHTGEPLSAEGGYIGMDVHRAARICAVGYGGQTLLSQTTRDLVEDDLPAGVSLRDLGEHRLKDLARPQRLFQVVVTDLPSDFPPLRSLDTLPNNLPTQLTSFVGREREKAEVKRLLSTTRLLTLSGAGGAGKTRLALQLAAESLDEFKDGAWLAELASLPEPALVPQTVASALSVREQPGGPPQAAIVDYLRPRHLLLVLDGCERLVTACAQLADALLRSCPHLRILATSQTRLGIAGETAWRVPSLSLPDRQRLPDVESLTDYEAVRLFVERGVAALPSFKLTDKNAQAVTQVCYQLDGIPLAVELAAARVSVLSPEQISKRLDDRFRLLTGGSPIALPRHQTLRAAMEWSYDLLSEEEQRLWRRLSVFVGGFTLEAAEAACTEDEVEPLDVVELLTRLVHKSLVISEQDGDVRYRLLETIRQYSKDRLREAGEERFRGRQRDYFLALAEEAAPLLTGPDQAAWFRRLDTEHENLRAALEWSLSTGEVDAASRLARSLWWFWYVRGGFTEGRKWLESVLAADPHQSPAVRAGLLSRAALLTWRQGNFELGASLAEEGLSLSRAVGDMESAALSLLSLSAVNIDQARGAPLVEESIALFQKLGDHWWVSLALTLRGVNAAYLGDLKKATTVFEERLALARRLGDVRGMANAIAWLARFALVQRQYDQARTLASESLAMTRETGDTPITAFTLGMLGRVALQQGAQAEGAALAEEGLRIARQLGESFAQPIALTTLGMAALFQRDYDRARTLLAEGLRLRRETRDRLAIPESLEALAMVDYMAGDRQRAARLLGASEAQREQTPLPLPPVDLPDPHGNLAAARASLNEEEFAVARAEGRAMTLEQAVGYALREIPHPQRGL